MQNSHVLSRVFFTCFFLLISSCGGGSETPEPTPDTTPEVIPDTTPEVIPDITPEVIPDTTPEVIPEPIPEPETTPVTYSLSGNPVLSVNEEESYTFTVTTNGFTSIEVIYSIDNKPEWATFDSSTGTLSGTPSFDDGGIYLDIAIKATDGINTATHDKFTINVVDVNRVPTLESPKIYEIYKDQGLSTILSKEDADGDSVTVTIKEMPSWLTYQPENGLLEGTPSIFPTNDLTLELTLDDGKNEITETIILSFKLGNHTWFKDKNIDYVTSSDSGLLFFYIETGQLVTFDPELNLVLDIQEVTELEDLIYHQNHQKLYLVDGGTLKTLSSDYTLTNYSVGLDCISGLTEADDFLVALDCDGDFAGYHVIDASGDTVSTTYDYADISKKTAWDPVEKRLYHLDSHSPSGNIFYRQINDTGYFTTYLQSQFFYDDTLTGPIVLSPDEKKIILGSGAILSAETLSLTYSITEEYSQAIWLDDGTLLLITESEQSTVLNRLTSSYETLETSTIDGDFIYAVNTSSEVLVLTSNSSGLNINYHVPNDDIDNDGVVNDEDAFPFDVAASIDSDFDGYPDNWNPGYSSSESSTNLTIDYFPLDGACWLSQHSVEGNSIACDYKSTMPIFEPSKIINDNDGTIYLLNSDTNTVYRWIESTQSYGNPIYLDKNKSITSIRHSSDHQRLYVLYDQTTVHYVNTETLAKEQYFLSGINIASINVVNNHLLVADTSDNRLYTYDDDAIRIDSETYYDNQVNGFIYNESNSTSYFLNDFFTIVSLPISPLGFFGYDDYFYHYDIVSSPIRLSSDGLSLISASGYSFTIDDLDKATQSLATESIDLQYFENEVVTMGSGSELESTIVKFFHTTPFSALTEVSIDGSPLALLRHLNQANLITFNSETGIEISIFDLADTDNDGLSNYIEINHFGSDPLLADSDADGLPDLYEVQNGLQININDALADADDDDLNNIGEYNNSSDVNNSDSDKDGVSDGDEVHTYLTSPTNRDSDGDAMPDGWEVSNGFDPTSILDGLLDSDLDGFSNLKEYYLGSDPTNLIDTPVIKPWNSYQGNADNAGFVAVDIDVNDISLRWNAILPDASNVTSSAVATQGKVINSYSNTFGYEVIAALSAVDGTVSWEVDYGNINSINGPSFNNDTIYFQTGGHDDSFLYALNISDGSEIFSSSYNNQWSSYNAPSIFNDEIYIAGGSYGGSYKFDGESGTESWFVDLEQCDNWVPAVDEDNVYYYDGSFKVASKVTGEVISTSAEDLYYGCKTPVIANNAVITFTNALQVFDKETAELLWQVEHEGYSSDGFIGTAAVALGKVFTNKGGVLTVYDEFSGEELWTWQPENSYDLRNNIALSMNLVFVSDYYNTYAIDITTQEQVWSYPASGQLSLSLEGALYIQSESGVITAINIAGDSDEDGLDDWWEELYGLDPNDATDAGLNSDSDALTNLEEFANGTNPLAEDSDGDGINDSDEVNTYLSNPNKADTDSDGMPDLWEVNQGLDLLNPADALFDADNDDISNVDEYTQATDPNDALSIPDIIEYANYSFEDAALPAGWEVDNSLASSWGITSLESTDGDYSIFSSSNAAISFSGYFAGNTLSFDAKNDCGYYDVVVYIDDQEETAYFDLTNSWQEFSLLVPRGQHTIRIEVPNCSDNYIDNIILSPIDDLFVIGTYMVTTDYNQLKFFDINGVLIKQVEIPEVELNYSSDVRDVVILSDGRVAVYNGTYEPSLSIYSPEKHQWQHITDDEWSTLNNDSYGGIAEVDGSVYVTNMDSSYNGSSGIIKIDLGTHEFTYIDGEDYIDLTVGLDGFLYAMTDLAVHQYDLETESLIAAIAISSARSLAVDADGNIYTASAYGDVTQYSSTGVQQKTINIDEIDSAYYIYSNLQDININNYGDLYITNSAQQILLTDTSLNSIALYFESDSQHAEFLTLLPFIDNDDDGLPHWWENKYGLSDDDANDASTDLDAEGVNNLDEYLAKTDPSMADTDNDTLDDFLELNTYLTNPLLVDTDGDGLTDGDEINIHLTDPLDADSDDDSFSDGDEVLLYETDPLDFDSAPELDLVNFNIGIIPSFMTDASDSDASWYIDDDALRSGDIGDSQNSSIVYSKTFTSGTLSFDALVSSESCCDRLEVNLDGDTVIYDSSQETVSYAIELTAGEHSISFSYVKDGSISSGSDAVWIDNILFTPN